MIKSLDSVAAGHMCVDVTPVFNDTGATKINDVLKPGKLVNVDPAKISLGGPVPNTGLALKIYGLSLAVMAGLGDDEFGEIGVRLLSEYGVTGIKPTPGATTSYTVALALPGIDRIFLHCPGKNDTFTSADIDFETVAKARHFHLGYPPLMKGMMADDGKELAETFRKAKEADATTSLDMSLPDVDSPSGRAPWDVILKNTLPYVDIFMPSIEEIYMMLDRDGYIALRDAHPDDDLVEHVPVSDYPRLAKMALDLGCGLCVIKSARRGYYLRGCTAERLAKFGSAATPDAAAWADRELWAPAYRVPKIATATGSGDSSIAGFLAAFLRDYEPERCMRLGCASGHHNLKVLDALSGLPTFEELEKFADTFTDIENPNIDGTGFELDEAAKVYKGSGDRQSA